MGIYLLGLFSGVALVVIVEGLLYQGAMDRIRDDEEQAEFLEEWKEAHKR